MTLTKTLRSEIIFNQGKEGGGNEYVRTGDGGQDFGGQDGKAVDRLAHLVGVAWSQKGLEFEDGLTAQGKISSSAFAYSS